MMDPDTPLFKLTVGELMDLIERRIRQPEQRATDDSTRREVDTFMARGIASLLMQPTRHRIEERENRRSECKQGADNCGR